MKTNDATRATAGALPSINRRRFLLNTTMAGAAVAVTSPAVAAEQAVELSIDELIEHHQAGLKAALESKFGEKAWRIWAVGPKGIKGPSVFFNVDSTDYVSTNLKEGGAR